MRDNPPTPVGQTIYVRYKAIIEPVHGLIKRARAIRRFPLRGCHAVSGEFTLVALYHDLLKLGRASPAGTCQVGPHRLFFGSKPFSGPDRRRPSFFNPKAPALASYHIVPSTLWTAPRLLGYTLSILKSHRMPRGESKGHPLRLPLPGIAASGLAVHLVASLSRQSKGAGVHVIWPDISTGSLLQ